MIIGGGIGGLCLAQGLRRAGIGVTVYERTQARTDWLQGYRIHINPDGSRALYNSLPPAVWQRFRDTVSANDGGFGFATEQLDDLLRFAGSEILPEAGPADAHYGASRITLREVLLSDLDDVVRLGKTFERYETGVDGRVTAYFSDGTSATADVLIGADGANSRVRQQLLPDAERIDTGILAIAGKYRLDGANLPRALREDANMIIPTGSGFLFTAVWQPDRTMIVEEPAPDGFLLDNSTAYTFWAYADQASRFPLDSRALSGRDLQGVSTRSDRRLGAGAARADRRIRPEHGQCDPGPQRDARQPLADRTGDPARRCDPQHDANGRHRCQHGVARRRPAAQATDRRRLRGTRSDTGAARVRGADARLWLRRSQKVAQQRPAGGSRPTGSLVARSVRCYASFPRCRRCDVS